MLDTTRSVNTRIVLRNDVLSNWEASERVLYAGEAALARLSGTLSDKYEVRIGVGDKTWRQLSSTNFIIPVECVDGLDTKIRSLSTSYYETGDIAQLSGTYVNGDIAVEKKDIDGKGHEQYCAYRYNTGVSAWQALDGKYSAENVYLPKNMTITYDFGKYKIQSGKTSRELSCAGMNVQSFINDAFAETKQPSVTNPSFSFTGVNGGTGELGTKYTVGGATLQFNQGSYTYGPTPDSKAIAGVKLERDAKGDVAYVSAVTTQDKGAGSIISVSGSSTQVSYLCAGVSYTYRYSNGFYTASSISANNNIGGLSDPVKCISANSTALTNTTTATFTGYYPAYWGFSTAPQANPTALTATNGNITIGSTTTLTRAQLNANGYMPFTKDTSDGTMSLVSFSTSNKWYELFYLVSKAKFNTTQFKTWTGKDANNVDLAVDANGSVTVTFMDGQTAEYHLFVVRNAAAYSATTCTMKFHK